MNIPLTDFDDNPSVVIDAADHKRPIDGADGCVITFFPEDRCLSDKNLNCGKIRSIFHPLRPFVFLVGTAFHGSSGQGCFG